MLFLNQLHFDGRRVISRILFTFYWWKNIFILILVAITQTTVWFYIISSLFKMLRIYVFIMIQGALIRKCFVQFWFWWPIIPRPFGFMGLFSPFLYYVFYRISVCGNRFIHSLFFLIVNFTNLIIIIMTFSLLLYGLHSERRDLLLAVYSLYLIRCLHRKCLQNPLILLLQHIHFTNNAVYGTMNYILLIHV